MKAVIIVGGGPAGLRLGGNLAERGWETTIIEEHPEIGKPVQCSGLVSVSGIESRGLDVKGCIVNEVKGARIHSPGERVMQVERIFPVAYVVDRGAFDARQAKIAQKKGAVVQTNTQLINVNNNTVFVKHANRGEMIKSKLVVGADGVNSMVRELSGLKPEKINYIHTLQVRAKGHFDKDFVDMYFGDWAKNFFAWVIPESSTTARIGLGSVLGTNVKDEFARFVKEKELDLKLLDMSSGLIPMMPPIKNPVKEHFALVGDSAFQTKQTTGGGIIMGTMAADSLTKTITNHLKHGHSMNSYEKELKPVNHELEMHWKIRKFLNSMKPQEMDKIIEKMNKLQVAEFLNKEGDMDRPSRFVPQLFKNPRYLSLLPSAIKFFLS